MAEHKRGPQSEKKNVRYLDVDVLEAARQRIRTAFERFDHVIVSFSGGKDSLALLHLTREVQLEMGIAGPTRAQFRDEEVIPDDVVDFVQEYWRDRDKWDIAYYAVPLKSH